MQKSKKINILLVIPLISMIIVFPNSLISIQRDLEIPIEEKNPNEISNTRPPQKSSVYYVDTTGIAFGVYVSGDYAYVADGNTGLAIISISNPTNPGTLVYEPTSGLARDVYVSGDYAYVADGTSGLAIISISDPIITNAPSDFTVEYGYTGVSISWTATDTNPDIYTIGLQGVGVVAGPSAWSGGTVITYNVPDGLAFGEYFYTVNFTDDYNNYITDTVKMTVKEKQPPSDNVIMIVIIVVSIAGVVGVSIAIFVLRKKKRAITGE